MADGGVHTALIEAVKAQITGVWNRLCGVKGATDPIQSSDIGSDLETLREEVDKCYQKGYAGTFLDKAKAAANEAKARSLALSIARRKYQLGRASKIQAGINMAADAVRPNKTIDIMSGGMNA